MRSRFKNARRHVIAVTLSVAASALIVACTSQSGSLTSPSGGQGGSLAAQDDGLKGVICHATGSASNPYSGVVVGIGPNVDAPVFTNSGHLDYLGNPVDEHHVGDLYIGSSPPNVKQDCNCKDHPELPNCKG